MRVITLVPALFVFLLVGGQTFLSSGPTYADHCCYTRCWKPGCGCPGTGHCPHYRSPESDHDSLQTYVPTTSDTVNIRVARIPWATDRLADLAKIGDCSQRSFAMTILGDAGKAIEVESFYLDEKTTYHANLSLQVVANMEQ